MGKAPTGGNISTYKELCSLATDLNQPDLVYKFMHLANYNASWNSRKGAAFGFSSIAAKAGEQLEEHLPKIVPKLYRYQFDPTPNIQASMSSIWNALIPETNRTVDKYFKEIIAEISTNLTSNQWRVRESCCNALQDLLRGRTLDDAIDYLPRIWNDLFRVMDDIKETVRLSASKAAGALSRASIKMCDANQSGAKSGERAIQAVIPPLLENGLASAVPDVRVVVITTVAKITKAKEVNYLSVRLANDGAIQEKLDMARIAAAKSSSMMECVNHVLQFVDADTLQELVPRLIDLIKGSSGVAAKGTSAHLITTLTHQCPLDLQQYTGKILSAFVSGLTDRNAAVRKTYASSIGHLMKTAKDSSLEKLFAKLRTWYMEKGDDASAWAVAYTFDAINRHNPDRLKAHAAQALPVAFLAMHEEMRPARENEEILEIWQEVWSDGTPGAQGGTRLYLKEIMAILEVAIELQQWKVKAQAARAMGTVATTLGETFPLKEQQLLLTILINSLAGRTWDGKEAVVKAVADVCVSNKEGARQALNDGGGLTDEILMATLFRECKREKISYRLVALEAAGRVLKGLKLNYFKELYDITFPLIKAEKEEKDEDAGEEEEADREESEKNLLLRHGVYTCLGDAWPACPIENQSMYVEALMKTLHVRIQSTTKKNQLAIVSCLAKIIDGWKATSAANEVKAAVFKEAGGLLANVLVIPKSGQLRKESLAVLNKVMTLVSESGCGDEVSGTFKADVAKSLEDVIKDVSGDAATKALARDIRTELAKFHSIVPVEEMEQDG
jgi:proteasome component ECM29